MHQDNVITKVIDENFSLIMSFAFSRASITEVLDSHFDGEWKYLRRTCLNIAEERADRALLELATQLRLLDTRKKLSELYRQVRGHALGIVVQEDDTATDLHFRDMTNKVIHAAQFEWACADLKKPIIICHPDDPTRWKRAEINLLALAAFCGTVVTWTP